MELVKRSITGAIYVGAIAFFTLAGAWGLAILCIVSITLTTREFIQIVNKNKGCQASELWAVLSGIMLLFGIIVSTKIPCGIKAFIPFFTTVMITLVRELIYAKHETHIYNIAVTLMSTLYIALPISLLYSLSFYTDTAFLRGKYEAVFPMTLFLFIWSNDVGAYCVGCTIGKHPLCRRISPKKSWEGFFGGCITTILMAILLHWLLPPAYEVLELWAWIVMALITALFGTLGDLIESVMKREMGIKDSGNTLPGHGGFLDRLDSTLIATPAVYILIKSITL